jgi:predicted CXXCH cytochrome family protein
MNLESVKLTDLVHSYPFTNCVQRRTKRKEGIKMKKQIALLAAVLVAAAGMAYAATSIQGTAHDLSGTYAGANANLGSTEICIYCHTPHNPVSAVPLWNRINPSGSAFKLYNASPTLTTAAKGASFADNSVSLFCMSCHDGVTALGNIKNPGKDAVMNRTAIIRSSQGDNLTRDLTNSHPVGFNYSLAASQDQGALNTLTVAAGKLGVSAGGSYPFFNGADGLSKGENIECASCHKVHNDEYGKFLRQSNAGSALCLACHNK